MKTTYFDGNEKHRVNWTDILSLLISLVIVLISFFIPFVLPFILNPILIIICVTIIGGLGIGINLHYYSFTKVKRNTISQLAFLMLILSTFTALFTWISLIYVFTLLSSCYIHSHYISKYHQILHNTNRNINTKEEEHDL